MCCWVTGPSVTKENYHFCEIRNYIQFRRFLKMVCDTRSTVRDWRFPQQFSWALRSSGIWHCSAGLVFSNIGKEHNVVPSSSRVGAINFQRYRHNILSKEQETPATQCDVSKDLNPQYNLFNGVCPSYSIKKKTVFQKPDLFPFSNGEMGRHILTWILSGRVDVSHSAQ